MGIDRLSFYVKGEFEFDLCVWRLRMFIFESLVWFR